MLEYQEIGCLLRNHFELFILNMVFYGFSFHGLIEKSVQYEVF